MIKSKGETAWWIWAVAALFAVSLAIASPVMADEQTVVPAGSPKMGIGGGEGYEQILALLQEQDKKNSHELRQIKREIAALRQQLENPGIREIMGGVGYILGLFGVAAYVASRKKNIAGGN